MEMRTFKSPEDFRRSLESKLAKLSQELNQDLERIRRKVAFERLLARLFASDSRMWLLKGGYSMELRFQIARATQDVDLMLRDFSKYVDLPDLQLQLREALVSDASHSFSDYFQFRIEEAKKDLTAPIYGGARFPVEYVVVNAEQQFAEKFHAYTLRVSGRANTRVKDLLDMVLLIEGKKVDRKRLEEAFIKVFTRRRTHAVPRQLPEPPSEWAMQFEALAQECQLKLKLPEAVEKIRSFLGR